MNILEIIQDVAEGLNEVSKDWRERSQATDEIAKIVLDKKGNYTLDDIKKIKALVQITGRAATVASGSGRDYNKLGTAGGIFDRALQKYREAQAKAGNMPEFTSSATTAKDMANQIALNTNGAYKYRYPRTWISGGTGQRYKDPSDHVVYADNQSYDDAWAWIESKGKKVYYYNNFKNLKTAIKIGKFIVEPATITTGAFSSTPNTTHAISVRNASVINQSVRRQADISDQQAAALRDIAATKSQNAMQSIQLILKVLQGEQDIKQIIDNSKKINPQDKAKLDAIIAGAKNFKEPDQDVSESIAPTLPEVLYHGGPKPITKFNTPPQGVYFSPHLTHAQGYGDVVTAARVNANKVYLIDYENDIDEDIMDALFDMDYRRVAKYIKLLQKQGYDAMQSISDSEMVVVFPGTPIQVLDNKQGVAEDLKEFAPSYSGDDGGDGRGTTLKQAVEYIKSKYKYYKKYTLDGSHRYMNPAAVDDWAKKGKIDPEPASDMGSVIKQLGMAENPKMYGMDTKHIGREDWWKTFENNRTQVAMLHFVGQHQGWILIASNSEQNLAGAVQVFRDSGVLTDLTQARQNRQDRAASRLSKLSTTPLEIGDMFGVDLSYYSYDPKDRVKKKVDLGWDIWKVLEFTNTGKIKAQKIKSPTSEKVGEIKLFDPKGRLINNKKAIEVGKEYKNQQNVAEGIPTTPDNYVRPNNYKLVRLVPDLNQVAAGPNGTVQIVRPKRHRQTIHFSVNGMVTSNTGGDWTNMKYAIIADMGEMGQPGSFDFVDTWYYTDKNARLNLGHPVILAPQGAVAPKGVQLTYYTGTLGDAVETQLKKDGIQKLKIGSHGVDSWGSSGRGQSVDPNSETDAALSKYKYDPKTPGGNHYFSLETSIETYGDNMEKLLNYIKTGDKSKNDRLSYYNPPVTDIKTAIDNGINHSKDEINSLSLKLNGGKDRFGEEIPREHIAVRRAYLQRFLKTAQAYLRLFTSFKNKNINKPLSDYSQNKNTNLNQQGVAEGKVKLYTDPDYFGAEVDDAGFDSLPIINIPLKNLIGFEPDKKMQEPKAKDNVKKILAGLKAGDNIPAILVRKYKDGYQVLDGHHRFWAYKVAKKDTIPARVVDPKDIEEISKQGVAEDWQKVNKKDKTDGMSQKAVNTYRKENPGSKLKTAVTKKPSEIKSGSSDDKRRKSFCARMSGMKQKNASAKTKQDPDSPINKALKRWNC